MGNVSRLTLELYTARPEEFKIEWYEIENQAPPFALAMGYPVDYAAEGVTITYDTDNSEATMCNEERNENVGEEAVSEFGEDEIVLETEDERTPGVAE